MQHAALPHAHVGKIGMPSLCPHPADSGCDLPSSPALSSAWTGCDLPSSPALRSAWTAGRSPTGTACIRGELSLLFPTLPPPLPRDLLFPWWTSPEESSFCERFLGRLPGPRSEEGGLGRRGGGKVKADQAQPDGFSSCSTFSERSFFFEKKKKKKKKSAFFFMSFYPIFNCGLLPFLSLLQHFPPPLRCCCLPRMLSAEMNGRLFTGHAHLLAAGDLAGLLRQVSWRRPSSLSSPSLTNEEAREDMEEGEAK